MDILIDTQVLVWVVSRDPRLGRKAAQSLADTANRIFISYFSFFELTIKASIGKLTWDTSLIEDLPSMGIDLIMPDMDALQGYEILNPDNKDPFDNIIMSIARSRTAKLMTSDHKILAVSGLKTIDANS
jgi:PIN domain nuclease of toxin-antitoxin system